MPGLSSALGTGLLLLSAAGFVGLAAGWSPERLVRGTARPVPIERLEAAQAAAQPPVSQLRVAPDRGAAPAPLGSDGRTAGVDEPPTARPASRPIVRVAVPRIGLDAEVVTAGLVERDGVTTWSVPEHRAGHAARTAGAGEPGNAVLLGHVDSRAAGNVFRDLHRAEVGDAIEVWTDQTKLTYRVTAIQVVDRTDTSLLASTDRPVLTLVTCTGFWNPLIWEYTERLVVRAELDPA